MNIQEFIQEFVSNYFKARQENLKGKSTVKTSSDIPVITRTLEKGLNKVLDPGSFEFFNIPTLGISQEEFYNLMNEYSPVYISQVWANYQANKSSFLKDYNSLINAETNSLKIYGAVALNAKDMNAPEAVEYATKVVADWQASSNKMLGASFVYFRQYCTTILDGITRIIENEDAQEFMVKEKIEIDISAPMVEILPKLEILEKRMLIQKEAGLLEESIKFSLRDEIDSYSTLGASKSRAEEETQAAEA